MGKGNKLSFRKGDLLAIAAVVLLGVVVFMAFLPRGTAQTPTVQIFHEGELVQEYSLDAEQTLSIDGDYHNTVVISGGKVSVTQSDCPGRDCVHSGSISQAGRSIVCLPNRVEVRIVGQSDIDAVVR